MTPRQLTRIMLEQQYAATYCAENGDPKRSAEATVRRDAAHSKLGKLIEELRAAGETVLNTWPFIHADILSRTGAFREAYICPACGEDRPNHAGSCAASVLRAALIACEEEDE